MSLSWWRPAERITLAVFNSRARALGVPYFEEGGALRPRPRTIAEGFLRAGIKRSLGKLGQVADASDTRTKSRTWRRSVEQIMLAAVDSKTRVLGILSPDRGAGVSTLCQMVAESFSRSGAKTLLVDLTQTLEASAEQSLAWVPAENTNQMIELDPRGYDLIKAPPTIDTRPLFNNVGTLRSMFVDELADYKAVIVDLPATLDQREDLINPIPAARACDAVLMVCVTGRTTYQRIEATVAALGAAGVQLGGTILNDGYSPPLWR